MPAPDEQQLGELYASHGSVGALARHLGEPRSTVRYWLVRAGISIKTSGYKSPKSQTHSGADHHNWKGGVYRHSDGHVYEFAPDHPSVAHLPRGKRYVFQHRLVMERKLGRYLQADEDVHHVNEDKTDNRAENLELTSRGAHMRLHRRNTPRDDHGRFARG